jgi:hypothetical protein
LEDYTTWFIINSRVEDMYIKKLLLAAFILFIACFSLDSTNNTYMATKLSIKSISNINYSIKQGEKFNLPSTVKATMSNNTSKNMPIKWDKRLVSTNSVGTYIYQGKVSGYSKPVALKLIINPVILSVENIKAVVNQGSEFKLPGTVKVIMSNKKKSEVQVKWDNQVIDTNKSGEYTIKGLINGYNKPVLITLSVEKYIVSIENLDKEINQGDSFNLPSTVEVKLSDNTSKKALVTWKQSNTDINKAGTYDYAGIIDEYNKEVNLSLNVLPIKNKDVLIYNLPKALGMPKLTKEEISELVGKDPKVLKEKINTIYDMMQLLIASNFTSDQRGDVKVNSGDFEWHYNRPVEVVLKDNKGNCGGCANLVNYLLEGDYDEVGYINYSRGSRLSGHVFNYIKQNNKYYIFDLIQYANWNFKRYDYQIVEVSDLKEYGPICKASYRNDIKLIVSYTAGTQIPIGNNSAGIMMYFPTGSKINTIYDTPNEDITVKYYEAPVAVPNWN